MCTGADSNAPTGSLPHPPIPGGQPLVTLKVFALGLAAREQAQRVAKGRAARFADIQAPGGAFGRWVVSR